MTKSADANNKACLESMSYLSSPKNVMVLVA